MENSIPSSQLFCTWENWTFSLYYKRSGYTFVPSYNKQNTLDEGTIARAKDKYRRRLLFRVFDNIDSGRKSIYNVNVLTAIGWKIEERTRCPVDIIFNVKLFIRCETPIEENEVQQQT